MEASAQNIQSQLANSIVAMWLKENWTKLIEGLVFICVLIVVWSLFALPTVFYALPVLPLNSDIETSVNSSYLCVAKSAAIENQNGCSNASSTQIDAENELICAEGFYIENVSSPVCVPHCGYWVSSSKVLLSTVVELMCFIAAYASLIVLFVLAFWLQRDTILVFPTVYLVCICVTIFVSSPIILVAILKKDLFCRSENLFDSIENETTFCTLSGVVHVYMLAQISLWILFHAVGIFRGIGFPFFYRRLKAEGKLKYIKVATYPAALLLPLFPALLQLIDGYRIFLTSTEVCKGRNMSLTYYTFVLPLSIFFAITTTVLIAVFWKVLKEFLIKQRPNDQHKKSIKKAQAKIFMIMCYYTTIGVIMLIGYTLSITSDDKHLEDFQIYFMCQQNGVQPDMDCGQPPESLSHALFLVSLILLSLLPCVVLLFTAKCTCSGKCYIRGSGLEGGNQASTLQHK